MKFTSKPVRSDAVCICDQDGNTLWTRSGTFPLSMALQAYDSLVDQHPGITLFRSMVDREGQEQFAVLVPTLALDYLRSGGRTLATVQIWYQDMMLNREEETSYRLAAELLTPLEESKSRDVDILEWAFMTTQNVTCSWNAPAKNRAHRQWAMRSSMVGDVFGIRQPDRFETFVVAPVGFSLINVSSLDELGNFNSFRDLPENLLSPVK